MILHLLTDEKFTDYAIKQFSAPEMKSAFVLVPSNNMMEQVELIDRCTVVRQNSPDFEALLNRLGEYTGIIFHGLFWPQWQRNLLARVPNTVKVAWVFWGGEIYSRTDEYLRFLAPLTKSVFNARTLVKRREKMANNDTPTDVFSRVDYCLTDEKEEHEYACSYVKKNFNYLWYNYYSLEETVGPLLNEQCNGVCVWVGNSAAIKNNHLDTLWKIWKCRFFVKQNNTQIVIPLSYGDIWVRNLVIKFGHILLGKRMQALTEYMPREEYNALMVSCSTMIIGYWQPAAQGNIITAMWLGMRVYLSEKSIAYNYFKRIGCKIYSIEHDLNRKNPDVFAPMKQDDIDTNRAVLRQWYSKEEMHKRNLEIVKALS